MADKKWINADRTIKRRQVFKIMLHTFIYTLKTYCKNFGTKLGGKLENYTALNSLQKRWEIYLEE